MRSTGSASRSHLPHPQMRGERSKQARSPALSACLPASSSTEAGVQEEHPGGLLGSQAWRQRVCGFKTGISSINMDRTRPTLLDEAEWQRGWWSTTSQKCSHCSKSAAAATNHTSLAASQKIALGAPLFAACCTHPRVAPSFMHTRQVPGMPGQRNGAPSACTVAGVSVQQSMHLLMHTLRRQPATGSPLSTSPTRTALLTTTRHTTSVKTGVCAAAILLQVWLFGAPMCTHIYITAFPLGPPQGPKHSPYQA